MNLRDIIILSGGIIVSACGLTMALFYVIAPQKAIRTHARFSSLVTEESASDPSTVLQHRIMGVVMMVACGGFLIGTVVGLFHELTK